MNRKVNTILCPTVKPVHTAHHWLSERPCFRCVCQRRTHSKLVRPQLQRARQPVVDDDDDDDGKYDMCGKANIGPTLHNVLKNTHVVILLRMHNAALFDRKRIETMT